MAWGQLAWFLIAVVLWTGLVMTLPVDPDYTAGELLDHLMGWVETGVLYPALGDGPTLRVLNYPPLVPALARGLVWIGLPPLPAGRLANTLGLLALLTAVGGWARARGVRGAALAGTVGLLGASFPLMYGAGQFHIELWAAAGTVTGLALLDAGGGRRSAVLAGVALALACFAKQTQAIPALVALLWAWRHRRTEAPLATAALAVVGIAGSLAITAAESLEPWRHMLTYTVGTFSLTNLGFQFLSHVAPWSVLLAFAAWTLARERAAVRSDALAWYWVTSALWALSAARVGSSYAYFLDLHLATALLVGPRIFTPGVRGRIWPWLLAVQVVGANLGVASALATQLSRGRALAEALPVLCGTFPPSGPVLTEGAGLARACGRTPTLHPFIMTSLATRGLWDPAPFEASIRSGSRSPALLPFDPRESPDLVRRERWTVDALRAFSEAPSVTGAPAGHWVARW